MNAFRGWRHFMPGEISVRRMKYRLPRENTSANALAAENGLGTSARDGKWNGRIITPLFGGSV